MNARLTDQQVAHVLAQHAPDGHSQVMAMLAAEVAAYRAMRPKCPTCLGTGIILGEWVVADNSRRERPCRANCEDGFMPLADWVKLLVETLREATSAYGKLLTEADHDELSCYYADAQESFIAVLKMAGDQ